MFQKSKVGPNSARSLRVPKMTQSKEQVADEEGEVNTAMLRARKGAFKKKNVTVVIQSLQNDIWEIKTRRIDWFKQVEEVFDR